MSDIRLSQRTADALSALGLGLFTPCEQPERMAWVVLVLRKMRDEAHVFPRGKWATIQAIEGQLEQAAATRARLCDLEAGQTEVGT